MTKLVLAIGAEGADAILSGARKTDERARPPARLPARAYLAVAGVGIVGECDLGEAEKNAKTWRIPVSAPKRYARPRSLDRFGLARTPRSFRYL